MSAEFKINEKVGGELAPGSPRRYEPEGGVRKHNERIHKESKAADAKNLPFTFSKPKKPKRNTTFKCKNCGHLITASINTVGMICNNCKKYTSVEEVNFDD